MSDKALTANASLPCPAHLLNSDEHAIWWDRPNPIRYARRQAGIAVFVGAFFIAMASFAVLKAIDDQYYLIVVLCIGSAGVGLYAMSQPLRRYIQARHVVYLLTDKRAIVADSWVIKIILLPMISSIEVTRTNSSFADVLFFDVVFENSEGANTIRDGFIGILHADAVAREMRRLQAAAS
ncbi:MAG: hypothetical protein K2Z25_03140 [Beijerinckiaceae bacterium]|nr:hypothetical protein [Beijerinckiaceae bacterium]